MLDIKTLLIWRITEIVPPIGATYQFDPLKAGLKYSASHTKMPLEILSPLTATSFWSVYGDDINLTI
eukprot:858199-Ditylum_brightwellii.AAC.1